VKTLADLGARMMTFDDVRGLFPGAEWLWILDTTTADTPVHFVEGELVLDDLEAGDGPWVLIVHGDLIASGDLDFGTSDYKTSALVVCGSLRARNFQFTNGAQCVVLHDITVTGCVFGRYGDESAFLSADGTLRAHAVLLDHVTGVSAPVIDAVVCGSRGWRLPIDINYEADSHADIFVREALDEDDRFQPYRGWQRVTAGEPLFLPGAHERLRALRPGPWREGGVR
jgi:hypothetical protein